RISREVTVAYSPRLSHATARVPPLAFSAATSRPASTSLSAIRMKPKWSLYPIGEAGRTTSPAAVSSSTALHFRTAGQSALQGPTSAPRYSGTDARMVGYRSVPHRNPTDRGE